MYGSLALLVSDETCFFQGHSVKYKEVKNSEFGLSKLMREGEKPCLDVVILAKE